MWSFFISLLKENLIKKMTLTLSSAAVSYTARKKPSNTGRKGEVICVTGV
jgi:hypothetical protein